MSDYQRTVIHTCDIRHGLGERTRILAFRQNRRPQLADYDVKIIDQAKGKPPRILCETVIHDYPRALGVWGLFASVLSEIASQQVLVDEFGQVVDMPEVSEAQWKERGRNYLKVARECFVRAGEFDPEFVNPITDQMMLDFASGEGGI